MTVSIAEAAINLAVALGLSAVIGFERQWRNRLAGLRTNSLVSLGAARGRDGSIRQELAAKPRSAPLGTSGAHCRRLRGCGHSQDQRTRS
jgi:hypothetical protein